MIGNLLDPDWVSPATGEDVDVIDIDLVLLQATENGCTGETRVIADLDAAVLWAADEGAVASVRLEMVLARDERGLFRLRAQREIPRIEPGARDVGGIVSTNWARLKEMCREPDFIPTDPTDPAALMRHR